MARERRRFQGELAAWAVSQVIARIPFAGPPPDPQQINPYREHEPPTEAQRRLEKWMNRRRLRGYLKSVSGGKWQG